MKKQYVPPVQKGFGQFVDSIFLLVLVYLSLLAPLLMKTPETQAAAQDSQVAVTWQDLKQEPTMAAQWQKLGYDAAKAKPIVNSKFDYTIEPVSLILTIAVIIGYFIFVLRVSDKEYREVIAEKFDRADR
jgi:hypothetical protein